MKFPVPGVICTILMFARVCSFLSLKNLLFSAWRPITLGGSNPSCAERTRFLHQISWLRRVFGSE